MVPPADTEPIPQHHTPIRNPRIEREISQNCSKRSPRIPQFHASFVNASLFCQRKTATNKYALLAQQRTSTSSPCHLAHANAHHTRMKCGYSRPRTNRDAGNSTTAPHWHVGVRRLNGTPHPDMPCPTSTRRALRPKRSARMHLTRIQEGTHPCKPKSSSCSIP